MLRDSRTAHQLWDQQSLLTSNYDVGTEFTDHFVVLDKTSTSILVRCGDSPLNNPDSARAMDGIFEISAKVEVDEEFAEFKLRSIFYQGDPKLNGVTQPPMGPYSQQLHLLYTKVWMESAMNHVKQ